MAGTREVFPMSSPALQRRNGISERDSAARDFCVQELHHAAVERDGALVFVLWLLECGNDFPRRLYLFRRRRKHRVAWLDLRGMDQRLAVEAEGAALAAGRVEAVGVVDVVIDAVDDGKAEGSPGRHRQRKRGGKILPVGRMESAKLLDEIIRAHDEAGKASSGCGDCGDWFGIGKSFCFNNFAFDHDDYHNDSRDRDRAIGPCAGRFEFAVCRIAFRDDADFDDSDFDFDNGDFDNGDFTDFRRTDALFPTSDCRS